MNVLNFWMTMIISIKFFLYILPLNLNVESADYKFLNTPETISGGIIREIAKANSYLVKQTNEKTLDGPTDIQKFGVVLNSYASAKKNTIALNKAVNSGLDLYIPIGDIYTDGVVKTIENKHISIQGTGLRSRFIHIATTDLFDFSSGVSGKVDGITLSASVNMKGENTAIKVKTVKGILPSIALSNIKITRMGGQLEWGKGIVLIDPDESIVENVIIDGINIRELKKEPTFRGIEINNSRASVSSTFRNVKVYNGKEGFFLRSVTNKGIEGIKFYGCDAVGVQTGFDLQSTYDFNKYMPPQILINGCHVNAEVSCIKIQNYIQAIISDCDFYAAPLANKLCVAIDSKNTSNLKIISTDIYNVGNGSIYGIIIGGNGTTRAQLRDITIEMGIASKKNAAVILTENTSGCFVDNIHRVGGNATVVDKGVNNTIRNTFNDNALETF